MKVWSVAELIAELNQRLPGVTCGLSGRACVFNCGYFTACLMCDTNVESRRAAGIERLL